MAEGQVLNKNKQYRKDKPWDSDEIDHWKIEEFKPGDMPHPLVEESSFMTLFPKYREKYLKEVWPIVVEKLKTYGISSELNLLEGSMTVKTTRKVWDPYAIIKARDLIKLLSRSVPVVHAIKIMQDDMNCDIIKIGNIVRNSERFVKRRERLIGPNGATLKAIELLTNCYVLVQGQTVSAMGSFKGLRWVRKIVIDTMKNIHPIYNIKELMIRRELSKDPALKTENWDRFLPKINKRHGKKRNVQIKKKDEDKVFPDPPPPRKVDLELETGEYFLKDAAKKRAKLDEIKQKQKKVTQEKAQKREALYVPPEEIARDEKEESLNVDTDKLLKKVKNQVKNNSKNKTRPPLDMNDYVSTKKIKKNEKE